MHYFFGSLLRNSIIGQNSFYKSSWLIPVIATAILMIAPFARAQVKVEPPSLDFGVVKPASQQTQSVKLTNGGPESVMLAEAKVECQHCTRVEFQPMKLAAGQSLEVPITFAPPEHERGPVQRKVTFLTADKSSVSVTFFAQVTDTAALTPPQLSFEKPQVPSAKITRELELANVSDRPIKPLYATSPAGGPRLIMPRDAIAPGERGKIILTWDLPKESGSHSGNGTVYLDHPNLAKLIFPYTVMIVADARTNEAAEQSDAALHSPPLAATDDGPTHPLSSTRPAQTQPTTTSVAATLPSSRMIRLELKDGLTLKDLVEVIASQLRLNLVYEESALNVPMAVKLTAPLPEEALLPLLRSVLQAKGMALIGTERPEIWRIVASKEATQSLNSRPDSGGPDQLMTEIITPRNTDLKTLATILKDFMTAGVGQIAVVDSANLLIVTDYKTQIQRLRDLVSLVDKPSPQAQVGVKVLPVKAAEVGPLVDRVNMLLSQLSNMRGAEADQHKIFISPDPQNNQVVMVGHVSEFERAQELIERFDIAPALLRTSYPLLESQRGDVPALITQILGPAAREAAPDGGPRVLVVGPTVSVVATEGQHRRIREVLEKTGGEQAPDVVQLKAYRIQNRDAAEVEATLTRLFGAASGRSALLEVLPPERTSAQGISTEGVTRVGNPIPQPYPRDAAAFPVTEGSDFSTTRPSRSAARLDESAINITVDLGTNSLLIAASTEMHRKIAHLIEQLDRRQAQVLLEVMLVSVADSQTFSYAVEAALSTTIGSTPVRIGSDFGIGSGPLGNRQLGVGTGFNAAVLDPGSFSVFIRALATTNRARVLSLPQVLALDNKPALIRSVQQEPFTSINASDTVSTTSFGGFAEAGTTLEITPHIAPADYLNLEYRLELSSFTGNSPSAAIPPPRRSDTISSYVSVPDGHTVIVGGLQSNSRSRSVNKIPGLGDIPILGILGRSENRSRNDATFYVFVRPTILRASRFEDLKYLSRQQRIAAGVPGDFPQSEPRYIRQ